MESIDWFIMNLVNANDNIPYDMFPVQYGEERARYGPRLSGNDLQILFSGTTRANSIGHYIVAHYVHYENVVKIYNSLHSTVLSEDFVESLTRLYPGKKFVLVRPMTLQPDFYSCGVFAIAYATTILLGRDPATYRLKIVNTSVGDRAKSLRDHIKDMYEAMLLLNFPQY